MTEQKHQGDSRSGPCLTNQHDRCTYEPCPCDCHPCDLCPFKACDGCRYQGTPGDTR